MTPGLPRPRARGGREAATPTSEVGGPWAPGPVISRLSRLHGHSSHELRTAAKLPPAKACRPPCFSGRPPSRPWRSEHLGLFFRMALPSRRRDAASNQVARAPWSTDPVGAGTTGHSADSGPASPRSVGRAQGAHRPGRQAPDHSDSRTASLTVNRGSQPSSLNSPAARKTGAACVLPASQAPSAGHCALQSCDSATQQNCSREDTGDRERGR